MIISSLETYITQLILRTVKCEECNDKFCHMYFYDGEMSSTDVDKYLVRRFWTECVCSDE